MERAFAPSGSPGEENRTGGLPLDVSLVRRIWPCQGGEGHFVARLVKAGAPADPAARAAEEAAWLARMQRPQPDRRRPASKQVRGKKQPAPAGPAQTLEAWRAFARESFPQLAEKPARRAWGERPAAAGLPAPGAAHPAGGGAGRHGPEGALCAGGTTCSTAYGALCANIEPLTRDDPRCRAWLLGQEIEARAGRERLVLRDGGRLPAGRRQGLGRARQEPLPQGPALLG